MTWQWWCHIGNCFETCTFLTSFRMNNIYFRTIDRNTLLVKKCKRTSEKSSVRSINIFGIYNEKLRSRSRYTLRVWRKKTVPSLLSTTGFMYNTDAQKLRLVVCDFVGWLFGTAATAVQLIDDYCFHAIPNRQLDESTPPPSNFFTSITLVRPISCCVQQYFTTESTVKCVPCYVPQ